MNRYTIYCTEEQTKKALELGAPIEILPNYIEYRMLPFVKCTDGNERPCVLPTAEQMLGWFEEKGVEIYITRCYGELRYEIRDMITLLTRSRIKTRKEATLAAIDAALEYLSNQKSK